MKKQFLFILVVISLAIGVGVWRETHVEKKSTNSSTQATIIKQEKNLLTGTVLPQSKPMPAFTFIDHDNKPFTNDNLQNQWSFVFFGYTQCPELCPKTLNALSHISQRVGPNPNVQYLFISITPEIDTPAKLKSYFGQDKFKFTKFVGLTGDNDKIQQLAKSLGIYIAEETDGDIEHIGHSGAILLVNPKGELYGLFTSAEQPHRIAHDLKYMMALYAAQSKMRS